MKYYKIFGVEVGHFGWSVISPPAFAIKTDFVVAKKVFAIRIRYKNKFYNIYNKILDVKVIHKSIQNNI